MRRLSKTEPIVPGVSIGGVCLGDNAQKIVEELERTGVVVSRKVFENFGRSFSEWEIKGWGLQFVEEARKIIRVSCSSGYAGRYRQTFYPGMSVRQIVEASDKQLCVHGTVVVDGEFGVFYDVPEIYDGQLFDDVDSIRQLPDEMILERLNVMSRDWWR